MSILNLTASEKAEILNKAGLVYWNKKFPARRRNDKGVIIFVWTSAYADAHDHHYILNGFVWDELRKYDMWDRPYLDKVYRSADEAVIDLLSALERLGGPTL